MEKQDYQKKRVYNRKLELRKRLILSIPSVTHDRIKKYCQDRDYFIGMWCSSILDKHISDMEKKGEMNG